MEFLQLLRTLTTIALATLCQSVWKSGQWPKDWKRSVFISVPKKDDTKNCSNHQTIALITHVNKIILKIISPTENCLMYKHDFGKEEEYVITLPIYMENRKSKGTPKRPVQVLH